MGPRRPDRPLRPGHGDVHHHRQGALRPGLLPRLLLRALSGDLERRVHAVRQAGRRFLQAPEAEERRYRHGPGAHLLRANGREVRLRDGYLRRHPRQDRRAERQDLRRKRGSDQVLPHHRRPHAHRHLHHRRRPRRDPLQRRSGLRAAPPHPPRRAPRHADRHARGLHAADRQGHHRPVWRRLP